MWIEKKHAKLSIRTQCELLDEAAIASEKSRHNLYTSIVLNTDYVNWSLP